MKGKVVPNYRKRKGKKVDSLTPYKKTLKQPRQLNGKIHHILSVLTLNINGLNSPIKRHQLANWIKKEGPTMCCLQEIHLINRNKHWLRVKGWKKIYQAKAPQNKQE
jgi:hypothetical protein